ncbi:MAG: hypothetical protein H7831_17935 [Magnetococcus sp. WYHC-3]
MKDMIAENRIGRFRLRSSMILDRPHLAHHIMRRMIVVSAAFVSGGGPAVGRRTW